MSNYLTIPLIKNKNGKYSNSAIEILKPFKDHLKDKFDQVDNIMFQLMTLQMVKEGIEKTDKKSFEELFTHIMKCEVRLKYE